MIANRMIHENLKKTKQDAAQAAERDKNHPANARARFSAWFMELCTQYRGVLLTIFVLPISVAVNVLWFVKMQIALRFGDPKAHAGKVEAVSAAVRECHLTGKKMCTSRPGWQSMSLKEGKYKKNHHLVPTHKLVDILGVKEVGVDADFARRSGLKEGATGGLAVVCEPLVSMGQLSRFLIERGYTLPVVPELDELTVGGLLMGFGIESSSHKYGLFQEICVEFEVVLGDGKVIKVTKDGEHRELFYALPWSHGTMGVLVSATLRIIPCRKYIRIEHRRIQSIEKVTETFAQASLLKRSPTGADAGVAKNDFVECLMYAGGFGVLMTGSMTDTVGADGQCYDIGSWHAPWFYTHVDDITKGKTSDETVVEYVPLRSYYHRHTKGIFWEMEHIIPFSNDVWFRWLLGWAVPPNIPLLKVFQTPSTRKAWREQFVVQDMLVPLRDLAETLKYLDRHFAVYPMWLCPHLVVHRKEGGLVGESSRATSDPAANEEMYVDVGLYGVPKRQPYKHDVAMPQLEEFVRNHRGYQGMYAVSYMDRAEFDTMFHRELYDKCRATYGAVSKFPDVFDKTCGKVVNAA